MQWKNKNIGISSKMSEVEVEFCQPLGQLLFDLYIVRRKSTPEVANLFGVAQTTISSWLRYYEIPLRSFNEGQKLFWASGADTSKQRANLRSNGFEGHSHSDEAKRRISIACKGISRHAYDEEFRRKTSASHKANPNRYWLGKKRPDISILLKEARKRQILPKSRTKPELKLLDIIERYGFPFKYTGDGSFWVGNYNPDFVNCNGQKKIIEVFGDYWHSPSREGIKPGYTQEGRRQAFAKFGFSMLVIWEHELKTLPEQVIVSKVKSFLEAM